MRFPYIRLTNKVRQVKILRLLHFKIAILLMAIAVIDNCNEASPGRTGENLKDAAGHSEGESKLDYGADDTSRRIVKDAQSYDDDGRLRPTDDCVHPEVVEECRGGWCRIPSGCFVFGSRDAEGHLCRSKFGETQVQVTLTRDFEILSTELTQSQWQEAGLDLPNPLNRAPCPNCPVSWITVYEAMAYCNALSQHKGLPECYDLSSCTGTIGGGCPDERPYFCDGNQTDVYICTENTQIYSADPHDCPGYRLPTTVEWEYAARAGTRTATYAGDFADNIEESCDPHPVVDKVAWHCGNAMGDPNSIDELDRISIPVARKQPNGFGLFDMIGGAGEFCASTRKNKALEALVGEKGPLVDPAPPLEIFNEHMNIVIRGGGYTLAPCYCRSAYGYPGARAPVRWFSWGFRPVRTLDVNWKPDATPRWR